MGEALRYDGKELIYNAHDHNSALSVNNARVKIMAAIKHQLEYLDVIDSQWKPKKQKGCACKEKYVEVTHRFDSDGMDALLKGQKIKDFTEGGNGKIYPVGEQYVRAARGGVKINEIDEGDACLALLDTDAIRLGTIKGPKEDDPQCSEQNQTCVDGYYPDGTSCGTPLPPDPCPDGSGEGGSVGGLFTAQMHWGQSAVHMELGGGLMREYASGCGYAAAGSGDLSLYDVYPDTYSVNVTSVSGDDTLDANVSDVVSVSVRAVDAYQSASTVISSPYAYAALGHVADIIISRTDYPPRPEIIPVIPVSHGSGSGGYGSGGYGGGGGVFIGSGGGDSSGGSNGHTPIVRNDPPLCQPAKSCGCLPCEYAVQMFLSQTRLGPVSGAHVRLYRADEADEENKTILYEGETTISSDLCSVHHTQKEHVAIV